MNLEGRGAARRIMSMTLPDGRPLERRKKYLIALNTFDARSAGHRFMKLRALLETPAANCVMHPMQTRDALIDYFRRHKIVHKIASCWRVSGGRLKAGHPERSEAKSKDPVASAIGFSAGFLDCARNDETVCCLKNFCAPLAYLAMRVLGFCLLALLSLVGVAWSQELPSHRDTQHHPVSDGSGLPMFRPALLGQGSKCADQSHRQPGLDKERPKRCRRSCFLLREKNGEVVWSGTYRGTPGSNLLEQELQKNSPASNAKFIPAIHDHQPVDAIYYGTVTFAVVDGKPRLRIFSNQETAELEQEHDFIGPQPFFGDGSGFTGWHYPPVGSTVWFDWCKVDLKVQIDATGNLTGEPGRVGGAAFSRFWSCGSIGFQKAQIYSRVPRRQTGGMRVMIVGLSTNRQAKVAFGYADPYENELTCSPAIFSARSTHLRARTHRHGVNLGRLLRNHRRGGSLCGN